MKRIHLVCKDKEGITAQEMPEFESRAWDIPEQDAQRVVGGMVCFHQSKPQPSYFGGIVKGYRVEETEDAHSKRIVFILEAKAEARGVAWSGRDDVRAVYSGIVEM